MHTLIIYDSNYGNTRQVAEDIAQTLGPNAKAIHVSQVTNDMLTGLKLLVVGSPINAWRPTTKIGTFLSGLKPGQLQGCQVATFDTRVNTFIHGDAAKSMSKRLVAAGATLSGQPQGFIVKGKAGPLAEGEPDRARNWAKTLV